MLQSSVHSQHFLGSGVGLIVVGVDGKGVGFRVVDGTGVDCRVVGDTGFGFPVVDGTGVDCWGTDVMKTTA